MTRNLSDFECRLIQALKLSDSDKVIDNLKDIWAVHYSIEKEYIALKTINSYLLEIAFQLNLIDNTFIFELEMGNNWKFTKFGYPLQTKTSDFQLILFSRLDSVLSLTEIKKLPGYEKWLAR
jgi:hypothetical protein